MNLRPILIIALASLLLINSCSPEDETNLQKNMSISLKFESLDTNLKSTNSVKTYSLKIISLSPLVIESNELEVIEVTNALTGNVSSVIVERKVQKSKTGPLSNKEQGCTSSISNGYWYDGNDCFMYGTIVTDNNCNQLFIPADETTQILMNDCGWSDVA
ncbi:hypothetical protein [Flagellimonas aequoris]|uniref:Lipoprotein n=1 Tax=Flagellimonas aequoris TaxID=2306997 RepID=A0A418N6M5_9FLAO|nr:hypothetical protein [Allomuricauda aequoris]RIV70495.1 hypothetical protein D2U88_08940 [Allomuricauda aequoris]TXK01923.1 hypothetical protein FQ019_08865 [Allomuricauda aequoris]